MRKNVTVESPRDRRALAADAGFGRASFVSVVAGTLVAYGAFLVLLAIAGGIAAAVGVNTDLGSRDLRSLGIGGGIAVAIVLFGSYLFGGYVAGRMARRAGLLNGLLVFVLGLVVAAVVGGAVAGLGGTDNVVNGVRSVGLPTSASQWREIGTVAGIASLAAMLLGSLLGGRMGDRWHSKLLTRALDPAIGPEARIRHDAGENMDQADARHAAATDRVRTARAATAEPVVPVAPVAPAAPVAASEHRGEVVRGDAETTAARRADIADEDRYAAAQRAEADRIAAETAVSSDDGDRANGRGRHFLRRS